MIMAENIDVLHERIKVLKEENERLKSLLIQHNIPFMNGELNAQKEKLASTCDEITNDISNQLYAFGQMRNLYENNF